ncbi:MAG: ArnT family glycosyltransferase [Endomicrobiales bacterium]
MFAALVAGIVIFHRLGEACLGGDDCYYAEVSKEMAETGDYLTPRNAGAVDFHTSKPPMLYWMNALSGKVLGFSSGTMRLPAALLGFAGVLALLVFVGRYFNPLTGFFAALILTFTQQYLYHARSAVTDGPFAVFFALALFAFWAARSGKKALRWYAAGFFAGCAVMTRQAPGLFILPVIGAYIVLSKEYRLLKNPHAYGALLLALAVLLPWHLVMYARHGQAFLNQYFGVTLMTGITGYPSWYSSSASLNSWYAYFSILLSNYWPWLPFLVAGVYRSVRGFSSFGAEKQKLLLFVLAWSFVPFALFQAARVKQYHYLVPLYVPFAVLSAFAFDGLAKNARTKAAAWLTGTVSLLTLAFLLFPVIPSTLDSREFRDTMLLVPGARSLRTDLLALEKGFSHYKNCLLFYGDKIVFKNTEAELVGKIRSGKPYSFVLSREDFERLKTSAAGRPLRVVATSEKSVLLESGAGPAERKLLK